MDRPNSKACLYLLIVITALQYTDVLGQKLHQGQWKTYTAMSGITDLAVDRKSGNIWAVTTGGAFRFTPSTTLKDSYLALRNSDGLSDNDLTAVATDSNGYVYFGGGSGSLDRYTESSGVISPIRDIALASRYTFKRINAISVFGDQVFVSTAFGLSIYNSKQKIFTETITKFGTNPDQDAAITTMVSGDSIYVVLSGAVAIASKNSPNISAPFAWRIVNAPPGAKLSSVTTLQGKVVFGGSTGIYTIIGSVLGKIDIGYPDSVIRLTSSGNRLYAIVVDSFNVGKLTTSTDLSQFSSTPLSGDNTEQLVSAFAIGNEGGKVFGYSDGGVAYLPSTGAIVTSIYPEGPIANYIFDLHFAPSLGKLFSSHGDPGISVFEPSSLTWTGLSTNRGVIPNAKYTSSYYDTVHSKLWLSTGGSGLYSLGAARPSDITHYGASQGIPPFNVGDMGFAFSVTGKGTLDNHRNFIVPCFVNQDNDKGLVRTSDGNTFTAIKLNAPNGASMPFGVCMQDADDYYFVGTVDFQNPKPFGVIAEKDGTTTPIAGGNGQKLGSASVNALLVDQDNGLWCGTNVGVDVLTHGRDFRTGDVVFNTPRRLVFLDQQFVKAIALDGVGNKWVGTDNGVFIVSADGSDSLAHFTTANSPLIDNSILTIAIDPKSGEAYIGTGKGISRVSSIYAEGGTDYANMFVYPNPVIQIGDDPLKVTITGLAGGSTVKIFSASGRLITSIDGSQLGSTLTWNGKDENGKLLASGVYVVAAASPVTADHGQTKFVLIRK